MNERNDRGSGSVDPEEYVQENRETIITIIRQSNDPFSRACAWALLDRYTPDPELQELHEELDAIAQGGNET